MIRHPRLLKNSLLTMVDKLRRGPRVMARPLKIHIEINDVCNLRCPHCPREDPSIPKNTGHMELEVIEALRESFRHAAYVGLVGNGEPFLHPRLMEIVEIVAAEGAVPSIISNATLWKEETLRRLIAAGRSIMNISFDGGTKETFEILRRPAKFEKVTANMALLHRLKEETASPFPVMSMISCLTQSTVGETAQVVEIAAAAGVGMIHFQVAIPYADDFRDELLTTVDRPRVEESIRRARARGDELGVRVHFHSQWDAEERSQNGRTRMMCPNVMEQLHIDLHGNPRFCCYWGPEDLGNVTDTPVREIWNSPKYAALRGRIKRGDLPNLCSDMPCPNLRPHSRREIIGETWNLVKEAVRG